MEKIFFVPFGLLQNARDAFRNEKNNEFNQWKALGKNKVELDALIKEAQDYIDNPDSDRANKLFNFKGLKDKSPDNIARILWNIKKINKDLITPGRNTNLDNDLIVYQTVEEAVVKMKELGFEADLKALGEHHQLGQKPHLEMPRQVRQGEVAPCH